MSDTDDSEGMLQMSVRMHRREEWTAELVRLANAYREARTNIPEPTDDPMTRETFTAQVDAVAECAERRALLLDHAYNEGKAP